MHRRFRLVIFSALCGVVATILFAWVPALLTDLPEFGDQMAAEAAKAI